jgi:murein DD-endopeptidase MepM/ murein hydrolase activator NlpD
MNAEAGARQKPERCAPSVWRLPKSAALLAALVAGATLPMPTTGVARDRLAGAGGGSCSAWLADLRHHAKSGDATTQWLLGYMSGVITQTQNELGLMLGPGQMVAETAAHCQRHRDETVTDAVDAVWSLFTDQALGTPSRPAQPSTGELKFLWPAEGRLMTGFCMHRFDTSTDGINLALSPGTEVHATESGSVVYAGNELKGYRNLIIVGHDDGWVSAYAQSDEVLVKRGDVVQRGQVIARVGDPDPAEPHRLHFELRKGSTPVDPLAYLGNADVDVAATTPVGCQG